MTEIVGSEYKWKKLMGIKKKVGINNFLSYPIGDYLKQKNYFKKYTFPSSDRINVHSK